MLRTLSARILLSFIVLAVTFVVTTGTLIRNTSEVEAEVDLIGNGYVKAAIAASDLQLREQEVNTYLTQQIANEKTAVAAADHLRTTNNLRQEALANTSQAIHDVEALAVNRDQRDYREITKMLNIVEVSVKGIEADFAKLIAKPPIGVQSPVADDAARQAFDTLRAAETNIQKQTDALVLKLREHLFAQGDTGSGAGSAGSAMVDTGTIAQLLRNEHTIRLSTIYMAFGAALLGLAVTISTVVTLRPLRRLHDGARRVAAGDYASHIAERGPTEVAELAREFNSMARAVQERERELVRSERLAAVGKMAAMITHEVRNPLSSIGLNTELLVDELGADAEEARALCRAITREVDRLTAITEEYLAFARLPKPKIAAEPVNAMVSALAQFVRLDLGSRGVELVTDLDPDEPVALVDAAQIRQCLVNLVRNATDAVAGKPHGVVTLRTRRTGDRVAIAVEDDGVGIPPDVVPRLFDPFFSTKDGGSGLGLALTQQIVKDHGGDLHVGSMVGHGTTITLSVPRAA
jgi:two-component system NtrC family sensor kinase